MKVIVPGHCYDLRNLKGRGFTRLQFYQDPKIHGGQEVAGTSCQEVLRALIDRVQSLDAEKPWWGNRFIIRLLRQAIALFEMRAVLRKIEKEDLSIETLPLGADGHLEFKEQ